jgi:hypothetical protein
MLVRASLQGTIAGWTGRLARKATYLALPHPLQLRVYQYCEGSRFVGQTMATTRFGRKMDFAASHLWYDKVRAGLMSTSMPKRE